MKDSKTKHPPLPPSFAIKILRWFCPDELMEGVLGDFEEQYIETFDQSGKRRATRNFYWNVIRLFHPSIFFRNKYAFTIMRTGLVKSHLLVAIRSMSKYKFYTLINILGLSFGVTFILLVFL
jgi:putative ABC transport system permease protein